MLRVWNRSSTVSTLSRVRLSRTANGLIFLAAAVVTGVLFRLASSHNPVGMVVVATAMYTVGVTACAAVVEGPRYARDRLMTTMLSVSLVIAVAALVGVLGYTIVHGLHRFDPTFFWHSMRAVAENDPGGGAYHAILGTLEQVGIATVIAAPLGIMVAIYLVEYGSGSRLGRLVSSLVDVMTGLPSIVAGLFVLAAWVLLLGRGYSGFAGSLALIILMLPTVIRTTEEMLKLVPVNLREASYALGVAKWITVLRIVLPTAKAGIVTGVMLALARVVGETAPVMLTVFGSPSINRNPFDGPQSSLPLFVFSEAGQPNRTAIDRAWTGALTLILVVLLLNAGARAVARLAGARDRKPGVRFGLRRNTGAG